VETESGGNERSHFQGISKAHGQAPARMRGGFQAMNDPNNSLAEALAAILKPIVKEAIREAMGVSELEARLGTSTDKAFLTVKQAAETSGLGSSTIRLLIRKRQLRAQKVGRRVLIKRTDLERFLEANPIRVLTEST
jgi:excisionase family DNA binding protein